VAPPRRARVGLCQAPLAAALLLLGCAAGGCQDSTYLGPYTVALPPDAGAGGGGGGGGMMMMAVPETQLTLQYRNPTDSEQKALDQASAARGYTVPFPTIGDVTFELEYVVKNLTDQAASLMVGVDAANQFGMYDEGQVMLDPNNEDQVPPPPLLSAFHRLDANGSDTGVFSEQDLRELGVDLDSIVRFGAVPEAAILNSSRDTNIGIGTRPNHEHSDDTPALTQLTVKLISGTAASLDFTVRITDRISAITTTSVNSLTATGPAYAQ
jgi:hypothetical protein